MFLLSFDKPRWEGPCWKSFAIRQNHIWNVFHPLSVWITNNGSQFSMLYSHSVSLVILKNDDGSSQGCHSLAILFDFLQNSRCEFHILVFNNEHWILFDEHCSLNNQMIRFRPALGCRIEIVGHKCIFRCEIQSSKGGWLSERKHLNKLIASVEIFSEILLARQLQWEASKFGSAEWNFWPELSRWTNKPVRTTAKGVFRSHLI